jgi:hypothetical protein
MRDYALTCAAASNQINAMPLTLLRNWWHRRQLRHGGDPRFSNADLRWALSLPLSVDPLAALDDRMFRRARGLL